MNATMNATLKLNLRMFDTSVPANTTGTESLSAEMKTFYDKNLLRYTKPHLVHDQFGQSRNIPKNGGKRIEFRRFEQLPKALTPLTEGVTPEGQTMTVTKQEAEVKQYGGFVSLSDQISMTAIDNVVVEATTAIGNQAGSTLDTISREALNAGTNVQYAEGQVSSRSELTAEMKLTVKAIKMAVRALKVQNTAKINGHYVAIIHPDCAYDITEDPRFIEVVKYKNPERIFNGEIGTLEGVRFIETTEAKKFTNAGASGIDVYSTLLLGENAYATTKIEGGGLETIVKPLGSGGTADPLNQRSTVGWKAMKVTEILSQQYMVRIETASTYNDHKAN
ncbi:MAG: N4-gp56 family major capsid protein [Enterocloster clostridioformis]|nr:N4-gp56 family major capsid protein [Enterocloster clostridioformis]MCI6128072.1 N4-gp56 family major capsid protein [Enterocloster clostridioformis]MDY4766039.1 N4-gp56 family major capsid protein [Enterocloster clostridioformis]